MTKKCDEKSMTENSNPLAPAVLRRKKQTGLHNSRIISGQRISSKRITILVFNNALYMLLVDVLFHAYNFRVNVHMRLQMYPVGFPMFIADFTINSNKCSL